MRADSLPFTHINGEIWSFLPQKLRRDLLKPKYPQEIAAASGRASTIPRSVLSLLKPFGKRLTGQLIHRNLGHIISGS